MEVTEPEALGKLCPIVSTTVPGIPQKPGGLSVAGGAPEVVGLPLPITCQGSECMAWRWTPGDQPTGFCGLSGEPARLAEVLPG